MNYTLTQSAPVITECKDTSERIDLYLPYVSLSSFPTPHSIYRWAHQTIDIVIGDSLKGPLYQTNRSAKHYDSSLGPQSARTSAALCRDLGQTAQTGSARVRVHTFENYQGYAWVYSMRGWDRKQVESERFFFN